MDPRPADYPMCYDPECWNAQAGWLFAIRPCPHGKYMYANDPGEQRAKEEYEKFMGMGQMNEVGNT